VSRAVSSVRYRLRWPREVNVEQLTAVMQVLSAAAGLPVVLEARGQDGRVGHYLTLPRSRARMVTRQLQVAVPGLSLVQDESAPSESFELVLDLALTTARRSLVPGDPAVVCRAVLTALASARASDIVTLRWQLVEHLSAGSVPNKVSPGHESWVKALVTAPLGPPPPLDADARGALKTKRSVPGWRATGRIAVTAATDVRLRSLADHVLGALRTAEAPGVHLRAQRSSRASLDAGRSNLALNVLELPAMAGWPIGSTSSLPVERSRARTRPASKLVPSKGRIVGEGTGSSRGVALNASDALRHLHLLGPTGVGKSTLLLNLIVRDLQDGRGVVVIEPKGDLIADVLARIPEHRVADVVLLDPTDRQAVVGLNPLSTYDRSPELVADQLLAVFHGLYAASWGPRTQDILHSSLLTLAGRRGSTLVELPLLLNDPAFRRRIVGELDEPVVLQPFWAGFEAWTEAQRTEAIAPVMNKVRPFLLRANLRAVLGQSAPRFNVRQVFSDRKILLVNLAKGVMGAEAAALLGSLVVSQLWQATLERSRLEPGRRHPVFVYIDEFQDYLHLPTDLADALAAARGLGVGLTLAHQHLHQLPPEMRSAVLANARSRVCFQLAAEDARLTAAGSPEIGAEDLMELDAFEIYAQLVAAGAVQPWLSARTYPEPAASSDPAAVMRSSRDLYGRERREVDAEIAALRPTGGPPTDIGVKRSTGGVA
jgi:hypothetical protein